MSAGCSSDIIPDLLNPDSCLTINSDLPKLTCLRSSLDYLLINSFFSFDDEVPDIFLRTCFNALRLS